MFYSVDGPLNCTNRTSSLPKVVPKRRSRAVAAQDRSICRFSPTRRDPLPTTPRCASIADVDCVNSSSPLCPREPRKPAPAATLPCRLSYGDGPPTSRWDRVRSISLGLKARQQPGPRRHGSPRRFILGSRTSETSNRNAKTTANPPISPTEALESGRLNRYHRPQASSGAGHLREGGWNA